MNTEIGKLFIYIGLGLLLIGFIIWLMGDKLSWLGKLPGDFRIEKENFKFYFPLTTMVLLSIIIYVILHFIKR